MTVFSVCEQHHSGRIRQKTGKNVFPLQIGILLTRFAKSCILKAGSVLLLIERYQKNRGEQIMKRNRPAALAIA